MRTLGVAVLALVAPSSRAEAPSQILILGMHHSGTSVVSNLTMMMGAYGGALTDLLLHPENPLKFWERRDVVSLDERRLVEGVQRAVARRYDVPEWVAYGFDSAKPATKIHEYDAAKEIVSTLNSHRPWVTKDPRMCLVAAEWMSLLDAPLCLIVHREPLSVANSMMIYSHNVSLAEWASVYEAYYTAALRACHEKPTVVVQHAELVAEPYAAVAKLHRDLSAAGVHGLTLPAEERIAKLIRPSSESAPVYLRSEHQAVGAAARRISGLLAASSLPAEKIAPAQWLLTPRSTDEAIVTLLTTDNVDYLRGALVLGSSIRTFDSSRDMLALVTEAVPREWHSSLQVAGWTVHVVPEVAEFWWGRSKECSHYAADQGERWGHMATKLRLWELTQYKRVLYLDADSILTGPVSHVFESVTTFGAESPKYHSHFNAGVLLLSPSKVIFDELIALGQQAHANRFGNLIDCTEQGLLNSYFDGKPGREVTKLPIGRADIVANWASDTAPYAVHWITHVCPKPWKVADGTESVEAHCDGAVYAYWQRVWDRLTASSKDVSTAVSVGSREAARRKMRRLTGAAAGPSLVGRSKLSPTPSTVYDWMREARDGMGRQLREVLHRRELRRRRYEYDAPWSEGTWAWIAIVGTLALGLAAGALLHKLFIKAPTEVGKGMTVVQAKRMGFQALGEGRGPIGVVSAVDDDEEEDEAPPSKKGGNQ